MNCWFFGFDETITIEHTINSRQSIATDPDNLAALRKNIRNIDFLKEFLRKCSANGDKIFIATKQTNKKLIGAYMHALLGDDWRQIINGMCCINGHPYGLPGKNGHIMRITRQYWNHPNTENQKFSATEIINQLCDLYDYINQPENKDNINIHKNPNLDNKLGIINTSSWQKMVGVIREICLTILFEEAEKLQLASRADYLQDYCYRDLFKEHRSIRFFRKKESITKSVEKINQKMAEYRSALPGETLKNSGR